MVQGGVSAIAMIGASAVIRSTGQLPVGVVLAVVVLVVASTTQIAIGLSLLQGSKLARSIYLYLGAFSLLVGILGTIFSGGGFFLQAAPGMVVFVVFVSLLTSPIANDFFVAGSTKGTTD